MLPQDQLLLQADRHADLCEKAHEWGKEDALDGIHARGSEYFIIGGAAWNAYLEGYGVGLQLRKVDAQPEEMSEIEFMDSVLETLRKSRHQPPASSQQPLTRLTEEQLAEIENERPGEDFSYYPFLY
jgi:hypothetical protein